MAPTAPTSRPKLRVLQSTGMPSMARVTPLVRRLAISSQYMLVPAAAAVISQLNRASFRSPIPQDRAATTSLAAMAAVMASVTGQRTAAMLTVTFQVPFISTGSSAAPPPGVRIPGVIVTQRPKDSMKA